jgi:FKBP-type peptidyl-prolyl cis-trans isomerase
MRKPITATITLLATGAMLLGTALAQQTPASNSPAPATKAQPPAAAQTQQAPASGSQSPSTLATQKEKLSYALGMNIGKNLHRNLLLQGMKDASAGGQTLMTDQEAQAAVTELQNDLRKKQEEKTQAAGGNNQKEGEAFLAANKTKPGIVTLPSGLQYKILKAGTGAKPTATDSVVCNYRGTLIDGTEFDSSYKRGQPATFPVNGVIKGWTEALQLMPVGSKWQLFVPSSLAYGPQGPQAIGPNATLIFEVELVSIQKAAAPAAVEPAGAK